MRLFNKNILKDILYIAEIGVNHEGNIDRCKKLIKEAKDSGADVVKFQCFTPGLYVSKEDKKYNRIKKYYFNISKFKKLIQFCKKIKIPFLFTPVSHDWLDFIKKNSKTVKIASGDLNFDYLIKKIINKNFKIILSTGISDIDEINKAVKIIKKKYKNNIYNKLVLLHCVSNYPTKDEEANINSVKFLKDKFKLNVGYSNHVIGINACLAAICLGAKVIEFHFTDNKKRKFRDHQLSLNKSDVKKLILLGNLFNKIIGNYEKKIKPNIKINKRVFSKGIIFSKNLEKKHKIKINDLNFARPAKYFFANEINKLVGKKLNRPVKEGFLARKKDFI